MGLMEHDITILAFGATRLLLDCWYLVPSKLIPHENECHVRVCQLILLEKDQAITLIQWSYNIPTLDMVYIAVYLYCKLHHLLFSY